MADDIWYTKEHEWIKIDGEIGAVGISDHAAHALGDITFVELPKEGTLIEQFKRFSTVESIKAASDIYAPVSGSVVEVNRELETSSDIIGRSAEKDGWICKIKNINKDELKNLMDKVQYEKYLKELGD